MKLDDGKELLSICIPTRNRIAFLKDLLETIRKQVLEEELGEDVAIYVSDNASDDGTQELCRGWIGRLPRFYYSRNSENIGADANILHVRTLGRGQYVWVYGDDDILQERAIANVVNLLRKESPGVIVAVHSKYGLPKPPPGNYEDYRAYAKTCIQKNAHVLGEQSLITSNIHRADCYDVEYAREQLDTHLAQMYGLVRKVYESRAKVVVPDFPVISLSDNLIGSTEAWINLDASWVVYFTWLRSELDLPALDPLEPSRIARRLMLRQIVLNPFGYLWQHRKQLANPTAWRFALRRLMGRHGAGYP